MENKTQTSSKKNQTDNNSGLSADGNMSQKENMLSSQKQQKTLRDLLEDGLKDIYSAEKQLMEALPLMARAAQSEDLEDAFRKHLEETKRQVERLDKIFNRLNIQGKDSVKCAAMEGLIEEGKKIIEEYEESSVRDSALIIGAQKIEHYEIATYGSLCELADVLNMTHVCDLLDRTLEEEGKTDKMLTKIAQSINDEAFEMSER